MVSIVTFIVSKIAVGIFAGFLKLFPVYLFIIPGMICYALAKSGKIPELATIVTPDGKPIPHEA